MEQLTLDATRIEHGVQALTTRSRDARPLVMKWAVATVALADIIRAERGAAVTWSEIGAVAARWLEDFGRNTGQWKTHTEAALRMSRMGSDPPASLDVPEPKDSFDRMDRWIATHVQRYGFLLLRVSLGVLFVWLGVLKPLGLWPAEELVTKTWPFVPANVLMFALGLWEAAIGVGLLWAPLLRAALLLLLLYLPVTALPLLRATCFTHFPYAPTLEGLFVIANVTLAGVAVVVGSTIRHGHRRSQQERVTS